MKSVCTSAAMWVSTSLYSMINQWADLYKCHHFSTLPKTKNLDLRVWWIYWRPIWVVLLMKHIQGGIAFRLYAKLWWFIIDEWHLQRYDLDNISNQIISSFEWIKDGETSAYYELFYLLSWGQEIEETCRKIGKFIRKFLISSIWVCNN